jgi:hypothetical protein
MKEGRPKSPALPYAVSVHHWAITAEEALSVTGLLRDLNDWTLDTIKYLVNHHAYEPGRFDFKETLNSKGDPDWNAKIAKAVCSMANADGGFLIFGVRDRMTSGPENPEARIVGIPTEPDLAKEFGQKIATIRPEIHFEAVPQPIPVDGSTTRGVFVVHIPISARRPHMDSSKGIFYIRGDGGSARAMDYYEVRDQMLRTEELVQQVTLLRMKLAQWQQHCREMMDLNSRRLRSFYGVYRAPFGPRTAARLAHGLVDGAGAEPTSDPLALQ